MTAKKKIIHERFKIIKLLSEPVVEAYAKIDPTTLWGSEIEVQAKSIIEGTVTEAKGESVATSKVVSTTWHDVVTKADWNSKSVGLVVVFQAKARGGLSFSIEHLAAFSFEEMH